VPAQSGGHKGTAKRRLRRLGSFVWPAKTAGQKTLAARNSATKFQLEALQEPRFAAVPSPEEDEEDAIGEENRN